MTTPFDLLPISELDRIAALIEEISFDSDETIYHQQKTKLKGLDIIWTGACETFFINASGKQETVVQLTKGDSYGAFSILLNNGKSIKSVAVSKGTQVYRIPKEGFIDLCARHETFYNYFLSAFGKEMLNDRFANYAISDSMEAESFSFDRFFNQTLESLNARPIVSCPVGTPSYEAARLMEEQRLSCLFVLNEGSYVGYVTDIILRNKIVGGQKHSHTPVEEIMDGPIFRIAKTAFIYEAILLMFNHKIRYLIVEDNGEDIGVITRNKLLNDQAQSPFVFIQSVRVAVTTEELKSKWAEVPKMTYNLLTRGIKSELVNQIITNISDSIAQKVIEGVIHEIGPPPAKFVFMALGSEGRMEQTLKTDQDNAIIYEDKANQFREKTRTYFLHFAELVSERLDFIGFSFCTGGLMAKNPKWTHSLSHWKHNYNEWIEKPNPQSVMNFSTFFDCRFIYGEEKLVHQLQEYILVQLDDPSEYFFKQLADNALQYEPPLTFFRGIRTIEKGDQKVFNIKRAMTPIVDLVRVYALKYKVLKTNTGDRLAALREEGVFTNEEFHELMQSYYYLMGMRLRYQARQIIDNQEEPHNYVSLESLTKIELVTLKEIFKVIENFQYRIKVVFTKNIFG